MPKLLPESVLFVTYACLTYSDEEEEQEEEEDGED